MPPATPRTLRVGLQDRLSSLPSDSEPTATGLVVEPWAMPTFFAAWVAVGILASLPLLRWERDRQAVLATGAGLGPLMLIVAINCRFSHPPVGNHSPADRD